MSSSTAPLPADFAQDERVYFSKEANAWRLEQDDGPELEYDTTKGVWVPLVDEDLVKRQQAAYAVEGVDEETPAAPVLARESKKRKEPEDYTSATPTSAGMSIKRGKVNKKERPPADRKSKNTAVYVTGLPVDTELEELLDRFSKCGVIEEDNEGEPKVKMYAKDDGTFSGEALIVYFKEDSVTLALNILDEAELRMGEASTVMSVTRAEFGHKETSASGENGAQPQPRKTVDKKKTTRRLVKMQKKIEEWNEEDGFGPTITPEEESAALMARQNSRVVVLKHMFTSDELAEDAALLLDLKEDVREECSSLGEVTNVILYDKEEEGIMTVKYRDPISAKACLLKMNGRFFAGRRIEASLFTGKQRFKRSGAGDDADDGGADGEKKRLDDFAQWLLQEGE